MINKINKMEKTYMEEEEDLNTENTHGSLDET